MVRGSTIDISDRPKSSYDLGLSIHNKFDIEIVNAKTGEVTKKAEAYNIIKDALWTALLSYSGNTTSDPWFQSIYFGDGSGTPDPEQNGLFHMIDGKKGLDSIVEVFPTDGYAYHRRSITLGVSEYVGNTITEVGIGCYKNSTRYICTHAMLQDMNGNQISITKTDTDIINIYATVYVHWNAEGYDNGKIKFLHTTYGIIDELLGYLPNGGMNRGIAVYSGCPSESGGAGYCTATIKGDVSSKTISLTYNRFGVNDGNTPCGILWARANDIIIEAPSSGLPGTQIQAEPIGTGDGVTVDYTTKYPFPQNAEIYVDGVLNTDVAVTGDIPGASFPPVIGLKFLPEHSTGVMGIPMGPKEGSSGSSVGGSPGIATFYNPWASKYGVKSVWTSNSTTRGMTISVSNDLSTWHELTGENYDKRYIIPEEYAYYSYWKIFGAMTSHTSYMDAMVHFVPLTDFESVIKFNNPPAEGAVITANYYTPVVAKDVNHVFDVSITIHLGEYKE